MVLHITSVVQESSYYTLLCIVLISFYGAFGKQKKTSKNQLDETILWILCFFTRTPSEFYVSLLYHTDYKLQYIINIFVLSKTSFCINKNRETLDFCFAILHENKIQWMFCDLEFFCRTLRWVVSSSGFVCKIQWIFAYPEFFVFAKRTLS